MIQKKSIEDFTPTSNIVVGRNPRTAVGRTNNSHLLFIIVEGRSTRSIGMSLEELAALMKSLGAVDEGGQYTPIGSMLDIFMTVAPDSGLEELEAQNSEDNTLERETALSPSGMCGATSGGTLMFGLIGLVGMSGGQRRKRYTSRS